MDNTNYEIIPPTALEVITKTEIDMQIATAKKYPRDIKKVIANVRDMATMSVDIAQSCTYMLPRGGTTIDGKSVRFAEIIANTYGNIRAGARIIDIGPTNVTAQGFCIDLENNTASAVEVKGKIVDKQGRRYSEDMIITTSNALCAKAYRNAVFKTVPMAIFEEVYDEINQYILDNLKKDADLPNRIDKCVKAFATFKVSEEMITKLIGKTKDKWTASDLQSLLGYFQAIKSNEASVDEVFNGASKAQSQDLYREKMAKAISTAKTASDLKLMSDDVDTPELKDLYEKKLKEFETK